MAAAWGMEVFNEYLRRKQFILFTDHKPLEKLGHLHTKTLNHLQTALLEHDFIVHYKKGTNMPADYLSRLPSLPVNTVESPTDAAFDPFTPDLQLLQCQDQDLQAIFQFLKTGHWHFSLSKHKIRVLAMLAPKVFFDKNKLAWIRLEDHKYPRMALWLPEYYRKEALCETHESIFAGHNAALKSYIKLNTSYFLLLAKCLLTCPRSHTNMSGLPTMRNSQKEKPAISTNANPRHAKHLYTC